MLNVHLGLTCMIIQVFGIWGTRPPNHSHVTTVGPLSSILSKLHQNDFQLTYERTELARIDERYAHCQFRTFKYNRTTPVTNGSCTFKVSAGYDTRILVQAHKFSSNKYREFPIRFEVNFCEAVTSSAFGLNLLIRNGNIVCPIVKDKMYYVNYFTPDPEKFPPFLPNGRYMLELQFWYNDIEYFVIYNYGIIDRPVPIPDF